MHGPGVAPRECVTRLGHSRGWHDCAILSPVGNQARAKAVLKEPGPALSSALPAPCLPGLEDLEATKSLGNQKSGTFIQTEV